MSPPLKRLFLITDSLTTKIINSLMLGCPSVQVERFRCGEAGLEQDIGWDVELDNSCSCPPPPTPTHIAVWCTYKRQGAVLGRWRSANCSLREPDSTLLLLLCLCQIPPLPLPECFFAFASVLADVCHAAREGYLGCPSGWHKYLVGHKFQTTLASTAYHRSRVSLWYADPCKYP